VVQAPRLHGRAVLFPVILLSISSASILVRLSGAPGEVNAFWRLIIASALTFAYAFTSGRTIRVGSPKVLAVIVVAGVALGLHFALWMDSLFRLPVGVSTAVVILYPVHLRLAELLLKGSSPTPVEALGYSAALLGVAVFFSESILRSTLSAVGLLESLTASLAAAVYFYAGSIARRSTDNTSYTSMCYLAASAVALAYSALRGENPFTYLPSSWPWFLLLALVPMLGGHTLMNYMLKFYPASLVTSIAILEPAGASILSYALLGEALSPTHIAGVSLMILGVTLVNSSRR